jgi:hypothetical protein
MGHGESNTVGMQIYKWSDAGVIIASIRHHFKSVFYASVAMRIVRLSHVPIKEADPSGSASLFILPLEAIPST